MAMANTLLVVTMTRELVSTQMLQHQHVLHLLLCANLRCDHVTRQVGSDELTDSKIYFW